MTKKTISYKWAEIDEAAFEKAQPIEALKNIAVAHIGLDNCIKLT